MLSNETVIKVHKFALKHDWDTSFQGKSRGNQHLSRMVTIANFLATKLNANPSIVEISAWLHDFPLTTGSDYNFEHNKLIASSVLKDFSIESPEREIIMSAIASHEGTVTPSSLEAQIVHDADVLEKTGILGVIRHTWKLVHMNSSSSSLSNNELANSVLSHLLWRTSRLQTELAKDISHYLTSEIDMNPAFVLRLVNFIRPLAEQNQITEEIADQLHTILQPQEYKMLTNQLSLDYLKNF